LCNSGFGGTGGDEDEGLLGEEMEEETEKVG
jgi:hypothetical protein